jgi:hypothetical protein
LFSAGSVLSLENINELQRDSSAGTHLTGMLEREILDVCGTWRVLCLLPFFDYAIERKPPSTQIWNK